MVPARWAVMFDEQKCFNVCYVVQTTEDGKEFNITSEVTFPGNYVHKTNSFTNRLKNKLPYKKWKHARMKPFSDNETVSLPRGSLNHTWICDLNPLLLIDVHYYLAPKKINNDYIKYDH